MLKFFSAVAEKILRGTICSVSVKVLEVNWTYYRGLLQGEMGSPTAVGCGDELSRRAGQRCYGCQAIVGAQGDKRHIENATSCM